MKNLKSDLIVARAFKPLKILLNLWAKGLKTLLNISKPLEILKNTFKPLGQTRKL